MIVPEMLAPGWKCISIAFDKKEVHSETKIIIL
jgi:hypothetical protein